MRAIRAVEVAVLAAGVVVLVAPGPGAVAAAYSHSFPSTAVPVQAVDSSSDSGSLSDLPTTLDPVPPPSPLPVVQPAPAGGASQHSSGASTGTQPERHGRNFTADARWLVLLGLVGLAVGVAGLVRTRRRPAPAGREHRTPPEGVVTGPGGQVGGASRDE